MKAKNIRKNISLVTILISFLLSCNQQKYNILTSYEVQEEKRATKKVIQVKLIKKGFKRISREFEIEKGQIFEIYRFYDFDNKPTTIFKLNLSKLKNNSVINIPDSIQNNFSGFNNNYIFLMKKYEQKNGDLIIQKIGIEDNPTLEKYTFSKDAILKDVYY